MQNIPNSSAQLNGISANGSNGHGPLWLNRLLPLRRRAAKAADASPTAGPADYRAQDHVAYHPDGTYSHGKPATGESQTSIDGSGRVPAPAFGMVRGDFALLALHARAAALCGDTLESVKAYGASLFDGKYGSERLKFEERISAGRRDAGATQVSLDRFQTELLALPTVVTDERVKFTLPRDLRLLGLVVVAALFIAVMGAEWTNAAGKLFVQFDSVRLAYLATTIFVALGLYAEWQLARAVGAAGRPWVIAWRVLSPLCAIAYVALYAWRFGAGAGAQESASLDNIMDAAAAGSAGGMVPVSLTLDRWLYALQLVTGIVCGAALIEQMKHLLVGRTALIPNPDSAAFAAEVGRLTVALNCDLAPVAKAAGHLAEWQACRTAFIESGVRVYQATEAERRLIESERQILQRERDLLERQRRTLIG